MLFAIEQNVDFVSVSAIRDVEDVEELRLLLGNTKIKMLAKIENARGMDNFDSILKMSDGIVLDRGYLGSEVDVDLVVIGQKRMIAQVLITTHLLHLRPLSNTDVLIALSTQGQ